MPEAYMIRGDATPKVSEDVGMALRRGGDGGTDYMVAYMLKLRHTGSPNPGGGEGALIGEEASFTLATQQDQALFQPVTDDADGGAEHADAVVLVDGMGWVVRRLTPTECERLQGFPDGHADLTGLDPEGVLARMLMPDDPGDAARVRRNVRRWCAECPDGPRYKACGNSMAVPVIRWLGERIEMVDGMVKEMEL